MNDGLLIRTCLLAGRLSGFTTRITQNTALAVVLGPVRVAAWTKRCIVSSVRLLNPFNWRRKADGRRSLKRTGKGRRGGAGGAEPPRLLESRPTRAPSGTVPEAPVPEAPKTDLKHSNALKRLSAEVMATDPASEVAMIKVVARLETMLHKLADTAPSVSQILKAAVGGLMEAASGNTSRADAGRAVSEVARALDTAGRRLAAEADTKARKARLPRVGRAAAPPVREAAPARPAPPPSVRRRGAPQEVTRAEASAAKFAGVREKLVFTRALQDMSRPDEAVRARAARSLGGIRHELSARELSARLARDPSAEVRKECVNALRALEARKELPAVEHALSDTSASVRLAAVRGMYSLAGPEGAASLIRMLSDENEDVRRRAAACTGWLGVEHLWAEVAPLLKDESASVRRTALDALGNLKSPDAVAEVIGLLEDPEESVRKKALDVLQTITGKQMVETFPEDEDGRQLLLARWRAWQQDESWRWEI